MTSELFQIADSVAAEINGVWWTLDFTADAASVVVTDRKDLTAAKCTVVPLTTRKKGFSRAADLYDHVVAVVFEAPVTGPADPLCDQAAAVVQAIERFFRGRRLAAMPECLCIDTAWPPDSAFSQEKIVRATKFFSVLALTYRMVA